MKAKALKKKVRFNDADDADADVIEITYSYETLTPRNAVFTMNGDQQGQIRLLEAIKDKDYELIDRILSRIKLHGINLNATDLEHGRTILHHAIIQEIELRVIARLIDLGADVRVVDHTGRTALLSAFLNQNAELVLYLLSRGADVHDISNKMLALNPDIARVLENEGYLASRSSDLLYVDENDLYFAGAGAGPGAGVEIEVERKNSSTILDDSGAIHQMPRQVGFYGDQFVEEKLVIVGRSHSYDACCIIS